MTPGPMVEVIDLRVRYGHREALRGIARVVLWDQRGHGGSERGVPGITIERLGADLGCVLDAVAPEGTVVLVGHSMGGMVVQEIVRLAPQRVQRLVLYATSALGLLPGRFETMERSRERLKEDGVEATARRISATMARISPTMVACGNHQGPPCRLQTPPAAATSSRPAPMSTVITRPPSGVG